MALGPLCRSTGPGPRGPEVTGAEAGRKAPIAIARSLPRRVRPGHRSGPSDPRGRRRSSSPIASPTMRRPITRRSVPSHRPRARRDPLSPRGDVRPGPVIALRYPEEAGDRAFGERKAIPIQPTAEQAMLARAGRLEHRLRIRREFGPLRQVADRARPKEPDWDRAHLGPGPLDELCDRLQPSPEIDRRSEDDRVDPGKVTDQLGSAKHDLDPAGLECVRDVLGHRRAAWWLDAAVMKDDDQVPFDDGPRSRADAALIRRSQVRGDHRLLASHSAVWSQPGWHGPERLLHGAMWPVVRLAWTGA